MRRDLWRLVWRMRRLFQQGENLPWSIAWYAIYDAWAVVYNEYLDAGGDPDLLYIYGASRG